MGENRIGDNMYKVIAKQLNLDERQTRQLRLELESYSWLYSESILKRAAAIYGYAVLGYLVILGPITAFVFFLALTGQLLQQ